MITPLRPSSCGAPKDREAPLTHSRTLHDRDRLTASVKGATSFCVGEMAGNGFVVVAGFNNLKGLFQTKLLCESVITES